MNKPDDSDPIERLIEAREGYSCRLLSNSQFMDVAAVGKVIERGIQQSGSFKSKLVEYATAMSRSENMNYLKCESAIRDVFKVQAGMSMNELRKLLLDRQDNLTQAQQDSAYPRAKEIGTMIEQGDKISFGRAYAKKASELADQLTITDTGAKALMKEAFQKQEGKDLIEWGKEQEKQYYRPQIEAEKQSREAARNQSPSRQYSR